MECGCCFDDYDPPSFYNETFPVARKEHKCCECHGTILPGQEYQKVAGVWAGRFEVYKTCMTCYLIRNNYCCDGFAFTELRAAIWSCLGFDYTEVPKED